MPLCCTLGKRPPQRVICMYIYICLYVQLFALQWITYFQVMCLSPWVHFLSFWSLFLWVEDHVKFFSKNSCWICLMYRMMKCHPALRFCSTHHRSKSFAGSLLPTKELHEQNMGKRKSSSHFSDTIFMRVVLVSCLKMFKMLQVGASGPNDHPIPIISRSRCLAILWTGRRWCGVVVTTGWSTSFDWWDVRLNHQPITLW